MKSLATQFNQEWQEVLRSAPANFYDFVDSYELIEVYSKVIGEWRWGTEHEAVYRRDTEFIKIRWRESSGDAEIDAYDMNVKAVDVTPKIVETIVYV
jgi:hypothetical protein